MFTSWPPTAGPIRSEQRTGLEFSLPEVLLDTMVPPGDYALYVCFDPGGDSPANGACGEQDLWLVYDEGQLLSFTEGQVIEIGIDLDAGLGVLEGVDDAASLGCTP